jgi:DNA-binding transcriptional MerR regulator
MVYYMLVDLAQEVGVTERTLSKWVRKGALPHVKRRGPLPAFDEAFLMRARAVARLRREERLGLPAIAARLDKASAEEIAYLAGHGPDPKAKKPMVTPVAGIQARWEHVCLLPGLELHLAEGADEAAQRMAAAILAMFAPKPA